MEEYAINTQMNPHVKRVIQSFQNAAVRSLSGPNDLPFRTGGVLGHQFKMSAAEAREYHKAFSANKKRVEEKLAEYDNTFLAPRQFPRQRIPVFTPVDNTKSERSDTVLEGELIACFSVGGEKRLCLPQILNTVLREFTLQQINSICDELHIFCSRCNQVQLETLKLLNILPSSAPSCGLITRTDAQRLCNALLHANPERSMEPPTRNSLKVYHECFGKCKGTFNSDAYTSPDSKCVRCVDCFGVFSPSQFVCHSHGSLENRICHWGFDTANWRSYLLLAKDQNLDGSMKLQDAIEELKSRFDPTRKHKRRQIPEWAPRIDANIPKRLKSDPLSDNPADLLISSASQVTAWEALGLRQLSSLSPWSPYLLSAIREGKLLPPPAIMRDGLAGILPSYLHTGPPVLLNPERVVPYSESERYERHYTPNVSLAPSSSHRTAADDEDETCEKPVPSKPRANGHRLSELAVSKLPSQRVCKVDARLKDSVDYDIPTDTDDSSLASPTDSCKDICVSDIPVYKSTLQQEMDMIRSLLDGKIDPTPEARCHFLQQYCKLRARTEEAIQWLLRTHRDIKRELQGSQRQNVELVKLLSKMEGELKSLSLEKEYALKEARALKDPAQHHKFSLGLENRYRSIESLYHKVCRENHSLQRELTILAEKSASAKYADDVQKSLKSHLKMALDLTVPSEADASSKKPCSDMTKEASITVD